MQILSGSKFKYTSNHNQFDTCIGKKVMLILNVWNRFSGNSMAIDIGISSNIIKSPFPNCYTAFLDMTIYSDTLPTVISHFTKSWTVTELDRITDFDLVTKFREFSIEHLQRMRLANWGRSSGHLVLSHLGLALVIMLRWFSPELVMFPDFEFRTSLCNYIFLY